MSRASPLAGPSSFPVTATVGDMLLDRLAGPAIGVAALAGAAGIGCPTRRPIGLCPAGRLLVIPAMIGAELGVDAVRSALPRDGDDRRLLPRAASVAGGAATALLAGRLTTVRRPVRLAQGSLAAMAVAVGSAFGQVMAATAGARAEPVRRPGQPPSAAAIRSSAV